MRKPAPETFARRLARLRKEAGLSAYALAQRAGVPRQTVAKLEGGSVPSWPTVQKIARALGLSVTAFE